MGWRMSGKQGMHRVAGHGIRRKEAKESQRGGCALPDAQILIHGSGGVFARPPGVAGRADAAAGIARDQESS